MFKNVRDLIFFGLLFGTAVNAGLVNDLWAQNYADDPHIAMSNGMRGESLVSARDIHLNGSTLTGSVMAGREVQASGCRIGGMIQAGRDVTLKSCPQVGGIMAGRGVTLWDTVVNRPVKAGRELYLKNSHLRADASVGGAVRLDGSTIDGVLQTGHSPLELDGSTVGSIRIQAGGGGNVWFSGGGVNVGNVLGHGNTVISGGSGIVSRNGVTTMHVDGSGMSSINGFTVKAANGQTTVITPENAIYVNGQKVSGEGPKTYVDYQATRPGAPLVQGKGWPEEVPPGDVSSLPGPTIILKNGSRVLGDITFEGLSGKVLLYDQSRITGRVIGGKVENL